MATYALIKNNTIINIAAWDGVSPFNPGVGITPTLLSSLPAGVNTGWTLVAGTWTAPAPVSQTIGLTFLQFMNLFTPTEQAAIVQSADTQLKLFILMATSAGGLNLTDPIVVGGVAYLVSLGLITSARQTAILAGNPHG